MSSRVRPFCLASRFVLATSLVALAPLTTGCGKDETKKEEEPKKEEPKLPERPKEEDLNPEKVLDLSGPKAPEADTVLFAVDGALVPLACFEKATGKVKGGTECGALVPEGDQVYVYSEYSKDLDTIGGPKNALCEVGDKPTSRSAKSVDNGNAYEFAVWPKSAAPLVKAIPAAAREEQALEWDAAETDAVKGAITKYRSRAGNGDFRPQQKAEIDIDGDGKNEVFYAVIVAHPTSADMNLFSGVWMAPGGDMSKLMLIDESKRETDVVVLNGVVDLNGDGKFALWTGVTWDGGSGDRVVVLEGDKATPLSRFSCGA